MYKELGVNFYFPSLIMVIGLSACATNYTEISTTEPHAVLNFVNEPNLITRHLFEMIHVI